MIRRHYYCCVQGDIERVELVESELKELGIEAPRVFKKEKGKRAKRVDIQLTTEMLGHAHRGNYDLAVMVAGDEDYVPLVEAVQREGKRVILWFFDEGLSRGLLLACDFAFDLANIFFKDEQYVERYV